MSTGAEPRETTFRASLTAMRQQETERRAAHAAPQPALTRCAQCFEMIAFMDGELCDDCLAKR